MGSAREEALAAMERPEAKFMMAPVELDALLDTIPPSVLARLAIERGGMEQVGLAHEVTRIAPWDARSPVLTRGEMRDWGDERHRCGDCRPVYRLVEETAP